MNIGWYRIWCGKFKNYLVEANNPPPTHTKGSFYLKYKINLIHKTKSKFIIQIYLSRRHAGDLGNIVSPPGSATPVAINDKQITLGDGGSHDVAGRAIVVHAGEDDLGRGGDEGSTKTGNAGARVACGIIKLI